MCVFHFIAIAIAHKCVVGSRLMRVAPRNALSVLPRETHLLQARKSTSCSLVDRVAFLLRKKMQKKGDIEVHQCSHFFIVLSRFYFSCVCFFFIEARRAA